jgi:hypothetical protein
MCYRCSDRLAENQRFCITADPRSSVCNQRRWHQWLLISGGCSRTGHHCDIVARVNGGLVRFGDVLAATADVDNQLLTVSSVQRLWWGNDGTLI